MYLTAKNIQCRLYLTTGDNAVFLSNLEIKHCPLSHFIIKKTNEKYI
jgi:hypothetical protein